MKPFQFIAPPEIVHTTACHTAMIHVIFTWEEMRSMMGPCVQELLAGVAAQGSAPSGPWFTHHLRRPTDTFDFEASVPVEPSIIAAGRVQPSIRPSMKVARTVYAGAYEGLGDAWGEFMEWLEREGHQTAPDLWECYLAGPESGSDPVAWRTELSRQLLEK